MHLVMVILYTQTDWVVIKFHLNNTYFSSVSAVECVGFVLQVYVLMFSIGVFYCALKNCSLETLLHLSTMHQFALDTTWFSHNAEIVIRVLVFSSFLASELLRMFYCIQYNLFNKPEQIIYYMYAM